MRWWLASSMGDWHTKVVSLLWISASLWLFFSPDSRTKVGSWRREFGIHGHEVRFGPFLQKGWSFFTSLCGFSGYYRCKVRDTVLSYKNPQEAMTGSWKTWKHLWALHFCGQKSSTSSEQLPVGQAPETEGDFQEQPPQPQCLHARVVAKQLASPGLRYSNGEIDLILKHFEHAAFFLKYFNVLFLMQVSCTWFFGLMQF